MAHPLYLRGLIGLGLAILLTAPLCAQAQAPQTPPGDRKQLSTPAGVPGMGANHRLILKDGGFQPVRQYQVVGDRVRYLSQDRGEWEEMPADLVDWEATRKWERDHAQPQPDEWLRLLFLRSCARGVRCFVRSSTQPDT